MSLYSQCSRAAREIIANPALIDSESYQGHEGIFTELDVILRASLSAGIYTEEEMVACQREASQVMNYRFGKGHVVRFGPVQVPDVDSPDYVRVVGKIVYAPAEGAQALRTPNGTFLPLTCAQDNLGRAGRRAGTARDDLQPWADQPLLVGSSGSLTPDQLEILQLKAAVAALKQENTQLMASIESLRGHAVGRGSQRAA